MQMAGRCWSQPRPGTKEAKSLMHPQRRASVAGHDPHHDENEWIRRSRQAIGLSQDKFAWLVGITNRHLIRLENGECRPSRKLAARIDAATRTIHSELTKAEVLHKDAGELLAATRRAHRKLTESEYADVNTLLDQAGAHLQTARYLTRCPLRGAQR